MPRAFSISRRHAMLPDAVFAAMAAARYADYYATPWLRHAAFFAATPPP